MKVLSQVDRIAQASTSETTRKDFEREATWPVCTVPVMHTSSFSRQPAHLGPLVLFVLAVAVVVLLLSHNREHSDNSFSSSSSTGDFAAMPWECVAPPSPPQDRRVDKTRLTLANWNVEWLFLHGGRGQLRCPGGALHGDHVRVN